MIHTDESGFKYFLSLEEMKEEGFTPIKVNSVVQFFTLEGRKTQLKAGNIIPLPGLQYVVLAKYPGGDRYFMRDYHGYPLVQLKFYRKDIDFSGEDEAIENLRRYVSDGRVWILMTPQMVAETTEMLQRLYKGYHKSEGQLLYKYFVPIMERSVELEDYQEYSKGLTGFKTVCHQMETQIEELWKQGK